MDRKLASMDVWSSLERPAGAIPRTGAAIKLRDAWRTARA
jgi:hypothetical protein